MSFNLPTFNLILRLWRAYGGTFPISGLTSPTLDNVPCQIRLSITGSQVVAALSALGYSLIVVPSRTDVRAAHSGAAADVIECPKATGRYYLVRWVEDRAKGWQNEHRVVAVQQLTAVAGGWPYPTP